MSLVLISLPLAPLAGCQTQMPSAAAPPAAQISSAEQSQVEQIAQGYIINLQSQNYQKAEAMMSSSFRAATPPAHLKVLLKGADQPLLGAKKFQFDPAQSLPPGTHVVLRARFLGADDKPYRVNFLFAQSGTAWQVSGLTPAATRKVPIKKQAGSSAA